MPARGLRRARDRYAGQACRGLAAALPDAGSIPAASNNKTRPLGRASYFQKIAPLLVHRLLDDPRVGITGVAQAVAHRLRRGAVDVVAHADLI